MEWLNKLNKLKGNLDLMCVVFAKKLKIWIELFKKYKNFTLKYKERTKTEVELN